MTDIVERLGNLIECEMDKAQCELYATAKAEIERLRAALQAIAIQALVTHPPHEYARRALEHKP